MNNNDLKSKFETFIGISLFLLLLYSIFGGKVFQKNQYSCIPKFEYTYAENVPQIVIRATEEAIFKWENALNNDNLFTRKMYADNIIICEDIAEESILENDLYNSTITGRIDATMTNDKLIIKNWTIKISPPLTNYNKLVNVALHELGHSIGLKHSDDPNSVMYPFIQNKLHLSPSQQDIRNALNQFKICQEKR